MSRYQEIDLFQIQVKSVQERHSRMETAAMAKPAESLVDSLPDILKGAEFKEFVARCRAAFASRKALIIGLGGHVIKCGLTPLLIQLMEAGAVTCFAINGSVAIHDYELAFFSKTSEDVSAGLADGSFGMVYETTYGINSVITQACDAELGYGEALGKHILEQAPNAQISLLAMAYKHNIPVTAHIALGTDITHQTPCADGKAIGDCSLRDFRILCEQLRQLHNGGVYVNLGSAVLLPEVFLKALTVARNIYGQPHNFSTAVFDMNLHYRCRENVVRRPVATGGQGYYFIGHHEIMVPLWVRELLPDQA